MFSHRFRKILILMLKREKQGKFFNQQTCSRQTFAGGNTQLSGHTLHDKSV